jgi:NADH pyrophosphatase NudC (nudix superfamily)
VNSQAEYDISELQVQLKEARDAKWYRRLKILQLSMSGISEYTNDRSGLMVKKLSEQLSC